jgi:hypothetical protein
MPRRIGKGAAVAGIGRGDRYLRGHEITLTWDPAAAALQARATQTARTVTITTR